MKKDYFLIKILPKFYLYSLLYLSGCSVLYGNFFFPDGPPNFGLDLLAYLLMFISLLSFFSVYLYIEQLKNEIINLKDKSEKK